MLLLCLIFRPAVSVDEKFAIPSRSGKESLLPVTIPEGNDEKSVAPETTCLGEPETERGEPSTGGNPILNVWAAGGAECCFSGCEVVRVCTVNPPPGLSGDVLSPLDELALRLTPPLLLPNGLPTICRCLCNVCCDGDMTIVTLRDSVCGTACSAGPADGGGDCECCMLD